jgi:hypothetical protein
MKIILCFMTFLVSGCALNRDLPPWERFPKTHEPLMAVPHPNPNWP